MPGAELLALADDLLSERKLAEALKVYNRAASAGAEWGRCAAGRWTIHMLCGDFAEAWAESDAIRKQGKQDSNCLWSGEPVNGRRVIVRCLHGFGDAVQFFRYAPQLSAAAEKAVWQVPPKLIEIAPYFSGVGQVIPWEQEQSALPDWDVQIECMELASIFHTRLEELPFSTNYLRLPPLLNEFVARQMGPNTQPRVGLVWAAGEWDRYRSIPLELFYRLLRFGGCEVWNLQGGVDRWCVKALSGGLKLRDAPPCNQGILELAGVIKQLDLVIAVDTLAAHLAGAPGVPAWVMLQYAADWRWMMGRDDCPWYPSLRLFRQPSPGDWASVVREVEEALQKWLGFEAERIAA